MNNQTKIISFTSPKGGVGRTLTLANIAKIYSAGAPWAGIDKTTTLLVDFDFYAPGIHYYNFNNHYSKTYNSESSSIDYTTLQNKLKNNDIGLLFLFSAIINDEDYKRECQKAIIKSNKKIENPLNSYREYVNKLISSYETDITRHIIHIDDMPIFMLPAGSISNPNYEKLIFEFEWHEFINKYLGIYLIDCILTHVVSLLRNKTSNNIRVLIDQQAGISIPAMINRTLASSIVYVSGLNEQNKSGLYSIINNNINIVPEKTPWIILNQYNLREKIFDINSSIIDTDSSPHKRFRELDFERRGKIIEEISENLSNKLKIGIEEAKERISVTEFMTDAIQKEHFYTKNCISRRILTELIVKIENEFLENRKKNNTKFNKQQDEKSVIKIIGEKVQLANNQENYFGPFCALLKLAAYNFKDVKIEGYALTHEQIANLAIHGKLKNLSLHKKEVSPKIHIYEIGESQGNELISISQFDFISYPYYVKSEKALKSTLGGIELDRISAVKAEDSIKPISSSYLRSNIIGYEDYITNDSIITGLPLFITPQLLAFHNTPFKKNSTFQKEYRKKFLNRFTGFKNPLEIKNYSEIANTSNIKMKKLLLCISNEIAAFYEWQTISGIFNHESHVNNIKSIKKLFEYFFKSGAKNAIKSYLQLISYSSRPKGINTDDIYWDIQLDKFFTKEENSLIFLWADTIPDDFRTNPDFTYQLPPAFHYFEECWMVSIIDNSNKKISLNEKSSFFIKLFSKEYQQKLLNEGGLPVHKSVLSNIDNWNKYPFLPHIFKSRDDEEKRREIEIECNKKLEDGFETYTEEIILKRETFEGHYILGKKISNLLYNVSKQIYKKSDIEKEVVNFYKGLIDIAFEYSNENILNYLYEILVTDKTTNKEFIDYINEKKGNNE